MIEDEGWRGGSADHRVIAMVAVVVVNPRVVPVVQTARAPTMEAEELVRALTVSVWGPAVVSSMAAAHPARDESAEAPSLVRPSSWWHRPRAGTWMPSA